ncbi:PqqD family protein [Pseudactinotalea terrae]|uniref:PqqD family protein n=1 Tax=Pseudactinotalea terrae TaxID=1743262 RepID=UPI001F4F4F07|nr:PqqD family protein [Pseudactinotalea terrae]
MVKLRQSEVSWREIDGEMVVLDLKTSKYLTTNATGTAMLKLLVEERTPDDLARALATTFEVDSATAQRDVAAFLDDLSARGLLVGQ